MLDRANSAMVDRAVEAATDREAVDRVVANLRSAREPVYDPTDPIQAAAVERLRSGAAGRTGRLPCGSLRHHEAHEWTGQTTGLEFVCSGHPPTFPERAQLADRRLHEEANGITDSWREEP